CFLSDAKRITAAIKRIKNALTIRDAKKLTVINTIVNNINVATTDPLKAVYPLIFSHGANEINAVRANIRDIRIVSTIYPLTLIRVPKLRIKFHRFMYHYFVTKLT